MYAKLIDSGYICAVGVAILGESITEAEYNEILALIAEKPSAPSGYIYKLRADTLEWELVELPPEPDPGEEDAEIEDYEQALAELGVMV